MAHGPLERLPDELLVDIINQLFLESTDQVHSISVVNRRFHRLANEFLYSTFSLDRGDPALFIRTLASSPSLAKLVRKVDWDWRPVDHHALVAHDAFQFRGNLMPMEHHAIKNALGLDEGHDVKDLNLRLETLRTDAYLNLLLSFTPHVQTLFVAIPPRWQYRRSWFNPILDSLILSNLNTAHIVGPMRIRNIVPLFAVPSLQSLTLDHISRDRNRAVRRALFEAATYNTVIKKLQLHGSSVEHFHVQNCSVDMAEIAQLMRLFRHLKTFEFEFTGYDLDRGEEDLESFLHAVTHQRASLTSLSLKDCRLALDQKILEKVSKLDNLEHLLLDITMLCDPYAQDATVETLSILLRQLPRSLHSLHLIANDPEGEELKPLPAFSDTLKALAPGIKNMLPSLHTLKIVDWDPLLGTFACQTTVKALQLAFEEVGVKFLSQPHKLVPKEKSGDDDLVALENVEEDWLWVQWVNSDGLWIRGRGDAWVDRA